MSGLGVDARTDVYSLGVLLYELLVGALPFDAAELRRCGFMEIQRRIREVDPPRPSTRLSTLGDKSTDAAVRRPHRPFGAGPPATGRTRLDRDEGARERPDPALSVGIRVGRRSGAVSARRPRARWTADGAIPTAQARAQAPRQGGCCRRRVSGDGRRFRPSARFCIWMQTARAKSPSMLEPRRTSLAKPCAPHGSGRRPRSRGSRASDYLNSIALADRYWLDDNLDRVRQMLDKCPEQLRSWSGTTCSGAARAKP